MTIPNHYEKEQSSKPQKEVQFMKNIQQRSY